MARFISWRSATAAALAVPAAAAAVLSAPTAAATAAPPAPTHLTSSPAGATSLNLSWRAPAGATVKDYLISWAAGTAVPTAPATEDAAHVTQDTAIVVTSLTPGTVYTFAVRARDLSGQVGAPAALTASARTPGLWRADSSGTPKVAAIWTTVPQSAAAAMLPTGSLRVAAVVNSRDVYSLTQTKTLLGFIDGARDPHVAAVGSATVIAWTAADGTYFRFRPTTTGKWGSLIYASTTRGDRVAGVALDSKHNIHLLVVRTRGTGRGLWYLTNGSGPWTQTHVDGTGAGDLAALTRDPATNRIVVVDRHRTSTVETVRVAVLGAADRKVPAFATWLSTKNRAVQWRPTNVASYGGTISVAVQRVSSPASPSDGPYVLTGSGASHRRAARVAGTTARDSHVSVSMPSAKHALFSWQRRSSSWDPKQLGVWTALRSYNGTTKTWTFAAPKHWATTAYDRAVAAFMDSAGHTHVLYFTVRGDVRE